MAPRIAEGKARLRRAPVQFRFNQPAYFRPVRAAIGASNGVAGVQIIRFRASHVAIAVAALVGGGALVYWLGHRSKPAPPPAPLSVQTAVLRPHSVPAVLDTSGTILSPQSVEIRPQTDGILTAVAVRDGDAVRRGQVLFRIDPRPLRASLAQASGALTRDTALASDAADTERRYRDLLPAQGIDAKTYATARNTLSSLHGTVAVDRAQVTQARLSLGYTTIRAPISGRAGAILVKPGNLVTAGSTTPLLVINVATPIEVSFALPQAQIATLKRAGGGGLAVLALDSVSGQTLDRGTVRFLDNAYDTTSGTLAVRARFANGAGRLWPGQFVTIRVILAEDPAALTVPEAALQQGQQGPYVYIAANGKARLRQVRVDRIVDGQAVIGAGLRAGEQLIVTVPNELRDGSAVAAASGGGTQPAAAGGTAPR